MDDFEKHEVLLALNHRGRQVHQGWAQMYLRENPWTYQRRSKHEWELRALQQGHVVVKSTLRDWIKGQTTAMESGILSFEAVFLPFMLTRDGRPLLERSNELLPKPDEPKVVSLPASGGAA
jgi:hypothetical protein